MAVSGSFIASMVLFGVFFIIALGLLTGLNVPEIEVARDYIRTECNFTSSTVVEKYAAGTSCSYCSSFVGPSCDKVQSDVVKYNPVACQDGTGPCPPNETLCDAGYSCCATCCSGCRRRNEESTVNIAFDLRSEDGGDKLTELSPRSSSTEEEGECTPICFCCDFVFDLRCTVRPYVIYFATFSGTIVERNPTTNASEINPITISEPYGTDLVGAKARLDEVRLLVNQTCFYNPQNFKAATLSIAQSPWKWGVTATFIFLTLVAATLACLSGIPHNFWKGVGASFIWCVFLPLVTLAPALSSILLSKEGHTAIIAISVALPVLFLAIAFVLLGIPYLKQRWATSTPSSDGKQQDSTLESVEMSL